MIATLWPAAQILGDLASHLGLPGAEAHYRHALAIAEQAHAELVAPSRHKPPTLRVGR
jgi:hypothetical protein